jgi:hypothetical protein
VKIEERRRQSRSKNLKHDDATILVLNFDAAAAAAASHLPPPPPKEQPLPTVNCAAFRACNTSQNLR